MTELEALKKRVAHHYKEAMESATIACAYAEEAGKLRAFAQAVLGDWPDCGTLDGGDIQTLAENHGLLTPTTPCEPCGESCTCLEYYGADDFARGEVLCYRKTRLLLGPNVPHEGPARASCAGPLDAVVGPRREL